MESLSRVPASCPSSVAVGAALEASRACDALGLGQYIMMQLRFPKIGWVRVMTESA